jgi:hypothetical protein
MLYITILSESSRLYDFLPSFLPSFCFEATITVSVQSSVEWLRYHFLFSAGQRVFPFTKMSRATLRPTQPPTHWAEGFFPRGWKDRSVLIASSSAEGKNACSYASTPPYTFTACTKTNSSLLIILLYLPPHVQDWSWRHGLTGNNRLAIFGFVPVETRRRRSEHISNALPCPLQFVHVFWLLRGKRKNLSIQT